MNRGSLNIVGLGPGKDNLLTQEAKDVLLKATDIVGYKTYVRRVEIRPGLTLHASDNRVEVERATHALDLAHKGAHVVVVSSGDPGVFAMASAVFEALEYGKPEWKQIGISVLPGITAMLAASARLGAPLGHDFCAINLSDNLKPFSVIERRVELALEADFAMAFYNPRSKSRPNQFGRILEILRERAGEDRLISFARAVSTKEERLTTVPVREATAEMADMRTMVIVGSSQTRSIDGTSFIYTPRFLGKREGQVE
ncbi:MAG: precorrin-3B C(17)-methyltransferase [Sneathiellales bacterium]|nr:precorrin-3B C(17)-methyltransferase [Sneathiellales bacterium]